MSAPKLNGILWTDAEPDLLTRDQTDIPAFAPDLTFVAPAVDTDGTVLHYGFWAGRLPMWPFERDQPDGLDALGSEGVQVVMTYPSAYPMVPPTIRVTDPEPLLQERGYHDWHVAPGGALCLLQTENDWTPTTSPTELLLKAAGWRLEYALMKAGLVTAMTVSGIVSDPSRDHLFSEAVGES